MFRWGIILIAAVLGGGIPVLADGVVATNHLESAGDNVDKSKESVFTEENLIPFHINLYFDKGLYYELVETSDAEGRILKTVFSETTRLTGSLGGMLHLDMAAYQQKGNLPEVDNDIDVRRLRINSYGGSYFLSPLTYGIELGITGGTFYFNDGYLWWHEVPYIGSFKVGLFKAPMSLESLESSSATTMMEVGSPVSAFAPGYKFGLQLGDSVFNQRGTLYGGWYADAEDADSGDASSSYTRLIGRATWLAVDNAISNAPHRVHLGLSGSHMFATGDGFQHRIGPHLPIIAFKAHFSE